MSDMTLVREADARVGVSSGIAGKAAFAHGMKLDGSSQ
jgi:hypothetical protein